VLHYVVGADDLAKDRARNIQRQFESVIYFVC